MAKKINPPMRIDNELAERIKVLQKDGSIKIPEASRNFLKQVKEMELKLKQVQKDGVKF